MTWKECFDTERPIKPVSLIGLPLAVLLVFATGVDEAVPAAAFLAPWVGVIGVEKFLRFAEVIDGCVRKVIF